MHSQGCKHMCAYILFFMSNKQHLPFQKWHLVLLRALWKERRSLRGQKWRKQASAQESFTDCAKTPRKYHSFTYFIIQTELEIMNRHVIYPRRKTLRKKITESHIKRYLNHWWFKSLISYILKLTKEPARYCDPLGPDRWRNVYDDNSAE